MLRRTLILAAAVAIAATAAPPLGVAKKTKPQPCGGRYFLGQGDIGLIFGEQTPAVDEVQLNGKDLDLGVSCSRTRAAVRATKKGTNVRANLGTCGSFKGVKLNGRIDPTCATFTATVKAKKTPGKQFAAHRVTGCGDGFVDTAGGESCESDGDCPAGSCDACHCATTTTTIASGSTTTTPTSSTTTTTIAALQHCVCHPAPDDPECRAGAVPNGAVEPGEACDDGNTVDGDGCDNNCTPSGCGNAEKDPNETCDDGNTLDGDNCPSNCIEGSCTATTTPVTATVTWNAPSAVAGVTVYLDYPESKVNVPGIGTQVAPGTFTNFPNGATTAANVLGTTTGIALNMVVSKATALTPRPGTLFRMNMTTCQGAAAAVAGDFTCTVTSAFAPDGQTAVPGATCVVSVP